MYLAHNEPESVLIVVIIHDAGGTSNEHIHVGQPLHIRAPFQA